MVNWHRLQIGEKLVDELAEIDVAIFSKQNPVYISEALKAHISWRNVQHLLEEISKLSAKRTKLVGWRKEYRMAAAIFGLIDREINSLVNGCVRAIIASPILLVIFRELLTTHREIFLKEFPAVKMGKVGVGIDQWMNEYSRLERMIDGYREVTEDKLSYDKKFAADYIAMAKKIVELVNSAIKTDTALGRSLTGYIERRRIASLLRERVLTPILEDRLKEYAEIKNTWKDIGVEGIIEISRELEDIKEEIEFLKIAAKTDRTTQVAKKYQDFQEKFRLLKDLPYSTSEVQAEVIQRVVKLVKDVESIAESVRFDDSLTLTKAMNDTVFLRNTKTLYGIVTDDLFGEIISQFKIVNDHVIFDSKISRNFEELLEMVDMFASSESPAEMLDETEKLIKHSKLIPTYKYELENLLLKGLKTAIQILVNLSSQGFPVEYQVKDVTLVADKINVNREVSEKVLAEVESKLSTIADEARSMIVRESTDLERILGAKIITPRESPAMAHGYRLFKESQLEFKDMEEDVENLKSSVHSLISNILLTLEAEESTLIDCRANEELMQNLNEIRWSLLQPFSPITTLTDDLELHEKNYNQAFNEWVKQYGELFTEILGQQLMQEIKEISLQNLAIVHQELTEKVVKWLADAETALNNELDGAITLINNFSREVVESRIQKLIQEQRTIQEKSKLTIDDLKNTIARKKSVTRIVQNLASLIKEAPARLETGQKIQK